METTNRWIYQKLDPDMKQKQDFNTIEMALWIFRMIKTFTNIK